MLVKSKTSLELCSLLSMKCLSNEKLSAKEQVKLLLLPTFRDDYTIILSSLIIASSAFREWTTSFDESTSNKCFSSESMQFLLSKLYLSSGEMMTVKLSKSIILHIFYSVDLFIVAILQLKNASIAIFFRICHLESFKL